MSAVTMDQERLRKLVRRDVVVVATGSLIAIWTYSLVAAVAFGSLSELTAGRAMVAVAVLVSVFCIYWWAAGPPEFMRDRVMVLIPVFLIAGPGLLGVHYLGGGIVVGILSGAVGFAAAAVFGLMWGGRRRGRRLTAPYPSGAMSAQYIYSMHRVQKFHGPERQVLRDISLSFYPGAKIGVLGPNGAGKSTLLRIMAGLDEPSSGRAELAPGATVGLLPQEPQLDPAKDVRGNVEDGVAEKRDLLDTFNQLSQQFAEPMSDDEMTALLEQQGEVQDRIERLDAWNLDRDLDVAMDALRCPPSDADVTTLSGGERRRVALCRLLLSSPDLLLLDEPTNHLDAESVAWLEQFLERFQGTVLAVTHDRYFLDNVAGWILELDRGHGIPFQGNYSSWLEQKEARLGVEEKQASARRRTLQRELEWVRMAPRARHAKSKARLDAYEKLLAEEQNVKLDSVEIHIPAGERLGDKVVEAKGLSKGFGDRLLIEDLSFSLPPGGIVGVIGPNGAGKTTLFRMIVGDEKPDGGRAGDRRLGAGRLRRPGARRARPGEVRVAGGLGRQGSDPPGQARDQLAGLRRLVQLPRRRPAEAGRRPLGRRAQPAAPGQAAAQRRQPAAARRADQRPGRRHAARARGGADDFAGCAVVISHDRWFLNRVATHMLAFEGDSQVTWFEGSYDEYEEHRRKLLGDEAVQPHRITLQAARPHLAPLNRGAGDADPVGEMFARRFATVVACLKILFGVLELATGLIWLFVTPSGVQHQIQRLVDWMASQQPDNPAVEMLQRQLPTLFAHGTLVALGLVLLGSVKLAGALGLPLRAAVGLLAVRRQPGRAAAVRRAVGGGRRLAVRVAVRRPRPGRPGGAALVPPGADRARRCAAGRLRASPARRCRARCRAPCQPRCRARCRAHSRGV